MLTYIVIIAVIIIVYLIITNYFKDVSEIDSEPDTIENLNSSLKIDHYKYPIKLLYDNSADWEIDYVVNDLCNLKPFTIEPIFLNTKELLNKNLTKKIKNVINNNILVFSYKFPFESIEKIIKRIKPIIIIFLSDEYGNSKKYMALSKYTKLFLRQHIFKKYRIQKYNNVVQIPLGYMNGMFNKKYGLDVYKKPITDREYIWSFVGNIKTDRQEMINKFEEAFNDKYIIRNYIEPEEMANIYGNSIFIPNGRGNCVLDCFRLYEAVYCGAIPIVVGNSEEINVTFNYNGNKPPFIYTNTWDEAVGTCKYLLENKSELCKLQEDNFNWLKNMIDSIHDKMREAIENS
jgi:hypothetical protein